MSVPEIRISPVNDAEPRADGRYVLYWMTANRRLRWNQALDRALDWCRKLGKPLVILEALRCDYRWASDRLHTFVLQGMAEHAATLESSPVRYHPYVEPEIGAGRGLLEALARDACVVVTDEFPSFFLPRMVAAAGRKLPVLLEQVDANGLLPLRAAPKAFARAHDFRRFLQNNLEPHLGQRPQAEPLRAAARLPRASIPRTILDRWPAASADLLRAEGTALARLPIDHEVAPAALRGGERAGSARLRAFLDEGIDRYGEDRNHPDRDGASGLSPYLHFGHVAAHEIFAEIVQRNTWSPDRLGLDRRGARAGWWGLPAPYEAFLDQLITWREVGYNMCHHRADHDRYSSLPDWARATLDEHSTDPREYTYSLPHFAAAQTHDPLWNAAQRQLISEGLLHNYLRMLWGKKILEWSSAPKQALRIMIELNNKCALDGRNPNSYSGIFWTLGRYDRAWGPERPIFGKIRYMSSDNTARKLHLKQYLERFGE